MNDNDEKNLSNPWSEYRRLVMSELDSLQSRLEKLDGLIRNVEDGVDTKLAPLISRITAIEIKIGIISFAGGVIGYFAPKLIEMFFK
jgi:hypothetical protein